MIKVKRKHLLRLSSATAAVLIPPLAIAQSLVDFTPNSTLRASDLNVNFTRLSARIQELEQELSRVALAKERVYESPSEPLLVEADESASAIAWCDDGDDILLNCSCSVGGSSTKAETGSSLALNLRQHMTRLQHSSSDQRSSCTCGGRNDAKTGETDRYLVAKATCITIP